jgi:hypothetical protein
MNRFLQFVIADAIEIPQFLPHPPIYPCERKADPSTPPGISPAGSNARKTAQVTLGISISPFVA